MHCVKVVDEMPPDKHEVSYAKYTQGDMTYLVGSRPDAYPMTKKFFESVDGWISVTDTPYCFEQPVNHAWFPWHEERFCAPETLYGVIHTLNLWETYKKLKTIYIHCDAGTHRAPTVFGAWILGKYGRAEAEKIVKGVELVRREHLSNPLEYIDYHLWEIPEDLILIRHAARTLLNRYDGIIHTMEQRFKRRYANDREFYS